MPITPYTTPVQFEYKPLNLAAFAVPLAKMQEQFDLTHAAISNTDFDMSNLPYGTDPERAKEIIATARTKRDELATNLLQTKNYRQAAIKLNQLNKEWSRDPEKLALEGEAKRFEKRKAEEIARIDNGKADQISQKDYDQWLRDEIRKYETRGGASFKATYADPEGTWNKFEAGRGVGRLSNQEEELDKLVLDVASKLHSDSWESALSEIGMDQETMDKHFQKSKFESLPASKVAAAVKGFLLSAPNSRFKEWGKQTAHYNFLDMYHSGDFDKYAEDIVGTALEGRGKYLDKVKGNKAEDESYQMLSEMKKTGEYDPAVVEQLYTNQHLNDLFDMSSVGKVFEYNKRETVDTWRDIPTSGSGSGSSANSVFGEEAFWHPETDTEYSVPSFQSQMQKASTSLYQTVKDINNFAAGNGRAAIFGGLNEQEKNKLAKDPAAQIARGRNIAVAFQNADNVQEFMQNAKAKGINMTKANASTLFKSLSEGVGFQDFTKKLESTKDAETAFNSAEENLQNLRKEIRGSKDWKEAMWTLSTSSLPQIPIIQKDDKGLYLTSPNGKDKIRPNELTKYGISIPKDAKTGDKINITYGQFAKMMGYNGVTDAIEKGFDFLGLGLPEPGKKLEGAPGGIGTPKGMTLTQYISTLEGKISPNIRTEEMSFNLLNTPKVSKDLAQMNSTIGELQQHDLAYSSRWSALPGFNEDGTPAPGTNLLVDNAHKPVIQTHENNLYYKYYYKFKDGDVDKIGSIVVQPKKGVTPKTMQFINNAILTASGDDDVSKKTKDMLLTTKFDMVYSNELSNSSYKAVHVGKGEEKELQTIETGYPGQTMTFVKFMAPGAMDPRIKIYINDGKGNKKLLSTEGSMIDRGEGQIFTTTDPKEAKRFVANLLLDVVPQEKK